MNQIRKGGVCKRSIYLKRIGLDQFFHDGVLG